MAGFELRVDKMKTIRSLLVIAVLLGSSQAKGLGLSALTKQTLPVKYTWGDVDGVNYLTNMRNPTHSSILWIRMGSRCHQRPCLTESRLLAKLLGQTLTSVRRF